MENPARVILIDDDAINNLMCKIVLGKASVNTELVEFTLPSDGLEYIIEHYQKGSAQVLPTVLLLDLNMPDMDGWEFLSQLDALDESIKNQFSIFILSSSIDGRDKERAAQNLLIAGYIEKPITVDKVMQLFRN